MEDDEGIVLAAEDALGHVGGDVLLHGAGLPIVERRHPHLRAHAGRGSFAALGRTALDLSLDGGIERVAPHSERHLVIDAAAVGVALGQVLPLADA